MLYLLGFPTPVVETLLAGVVVFFVTSIYYGLSFEGVQGTEGSPHRESPTQPTDVEESQ